ncbi:MAG: response regulator, partial [Chloroflexi bacterium]|nr:response regulator [Chloroflexota bacterium]
MEDKHRVLIVEDDALLARSYKEMLVRDSCAAKAVPTGAEALRELDSGYYDLVLLDINLAGALNGFAVLERIRKKGQAIRVVILTAHGNPYDIERGLT